MPLFIVRNDICKMKVDAIVNAANNSLLGGGGVDGMIHQTAGPKLLLECRALGGCATGDVKITGAYDLPCHYIIHTVGPKYIDGHHDEERLLRSCYRRALEIALEKELDSIAFSLISSGIYGYPKAEAFKIAIDEITGFLKDHDLLVYLVIYDHDTYVISSKLFSDIRSYIDDNYVAKHKDIRQRYSANFFCTKEMSLDDVMTNIDESFADMLFRKIDEAGISDTECYKRANIDRKLFSKIRSNRDYHPSKSTVLALAIALRLSLDETKEMLRKAGFALSHSYKFDLIIEYFIKNQIYDIYKINEALFTFDQKLLGV